MAKIKKTPKFKNKKVEADGYKFDSAAERDYYYKLKHQKLVGEILDFELQPKYTLQFGFKHEKYGTIRAIEYTADFVVEKVDGFFIVDVKGMATAKALVFRKLFLKRFPDIDLKWIVKSKIHGDDGWIDFFELQKIRRENKKKKSIKDK